MSAHRIVTQTYEVLIPISANQDTKNLANLFPEVTGLGSARAGIQTQTAWPQSANLCTGLLSETIDL